MPNPDYATLLSNIGTLTAEIEALTAIIDDPNTSQVDRDAAIASRTAKEADKAANTTNCYVFVEELDRSDVQLFEYIDFDYLLDNPDEQGDAYIGDYVGSPPQQQQQYLGPVYSISLNKNSVDEGSSFTATLTVENRPGVASLPITQGFIITGINPADISEPLSGSFVIPGNASISATKTFNIVADELTEGSESLTITLNNYQDVSVTIPINDTSTTLLPVPEVPGVPVEPAFQLTGLIIRANGTTYDDYLFQEGDSMLVTLTLLNRDQIQGSIIQNYTITSDDIINSVLGGSITPGDFTAESAAMDGVFIIPENEDSDSILLIGRVDALFEDLEFGSVTLNNYPDVSFDFVLGDYAQSPAAIPELDNSNDDPVPPDTQNPINLPSPVYWRHYPTLFSSKGFPAATTQEEVLTTQNMSLLSTNINTKLASIN